MRKYCPSCSNAVELELFDSLIAEDPPLKLTVSGMPAARCTNGHTSPIDSNFMLWLIHELKQRGGALPAGEEKGALLFKKYLCSCGKELAAKPERRQSFPVDLLYEGYPAFKADLEMPLYKCGGCGKEQLRSMKDASKHTALAVAALNDAAKFPHSA